MKRTTSAILLFLCTTVASPSISAQDQPLAITQVNTSGSPPPLAEPYLCVRGLDGKPFDLTKAQTCIKTILASKYFLDGHIETQPQGSQVLLNFFLTAPTLTLTTITFGIPKEWENELATLATKNPEFLAKGDSYEPARASSTLGTLELLLESKGKRGAVTQNLHLDYETGTAQLAFQVFPGPDGPPRQLPPPYGENCAPHLRSFSETDVDDFVPIAFVHKLAKTRWSFCTSDAAIREDEDRLKRSQIFQALKLSANASDQYRDVTLEARGRPLKVSEIILRPHGLLSTQDLVSVSSLPLQAHQIYRQSDSMRARNELMHIFSAPGRHVLTFEEDEVRGNDTVRVVIHVLVFPTDTIYISGKRFEDESRTWPTRATSLDD
jgi:hypothetical protein